MITKDWVVGCVHDVMGENKFIVPFKDVNNREMVSCLITSICYGEDFFHKANEPISDLPKK